MNKPTLRHDTMLQEIWIVAPSAIKDGRVRIGTHVEMGVRIELTILTNRRHPKSAHVVRCVDLVPFHIKIVVNCSVG